jgi:UDP-glucose 4-epimerase
MPLVPTAPLPTLFIMGALGYIGSTFLTVLKRPQPSILVWAIVRNGEQTDTLSKFYGWTVTPVIGRLNDELLLKQEAAKSHIVVQASDYNRNTVLVLVEGVAENPKHSYEKTIEWPDLGR